MKKIQTGKAGPSTATSTICAGPVLVASEAGAANDGAGMALLPCAVVAL